MGGKRRFDETTEQDALPAIERCHPSVLPWIQVARNFPPSSSSFRSLQSRQFVAGACLSYGSPQHSFLLYNLSVLQCSHCGFSSFWSSRSMWLQRQRLFFVRISFKRSHNLYLTSTYLSHRTRTLQRAIWDTEYW